MNPTLAMAFLNGTYPYSTPVAEAKVSAYRSGSYDYIRVFYRLGKPGGPYPGWAWKAAYTSTDAKNFLNGTGGYSTPVNEAMICGVWTGISQKFYIFYRKTGEPVHEKWNVAVKSSSNQVLDFFNGTDIIVKWPGYVKLYGKTLIVLLDWIQNRKHALAAVRELE